MPHINNHDANTLVHNYLKGLPKDQTRTAFIPAKEVSQLLNQTLVGLRIYLGKDSDGHLQLIVKPEKSSKEEAPLAENVKGGGDDVILSIPCPPICG